MPIQKTNNIREIIDLIQAADINNQRRISFEYILFKGINDSTGHVKELARLLNGIKCRMNIIRFHKIPGSVFISPSLQEAELFRDALNKRHPGDSQKIKR